MTPTPGTRPVSSVGLATNWRLSTVGNQTHPDSSEKFLYRQLSICFSSCIFYSGIFHHCYLLLLFPLLHTCIFHPCDLLLLLPLLHFPLPHFQRPQRDFTFAKNASGTFHGISIQTHRHSSCAAAAAI